MVTRAQIRGVVSLLALLGVPGLAPGAERPAEAPDLFLNAGQLTSLKARIAAKDQRLAGLVAEVERLAADSLTAGPWSVTFTPSSAASGDPHDYYSEGPYWWPDPGNPGGPYIRRDGEVNPARFVAHERAIAQMSFAVLRLGLAAFLLDDSRCAERAALLARVWFSDEQTRMSPHLEHAQAVRGVNTGRGIGIIDTRPLVWCLQGLTLLRQHGGWPEKEQAGVDAWTAQYLRWLAESAKGLEEKRNGNNHSTWWAVQVAAMAIYMGDPEAQSAVWGFSRESLVPQQIRPDGSCPLEEERTKSLHYSAMNLDGFAQLAHLAASQGVDLWRLRAKESGSVAQAVAYLAPYLRQPQTWKKPQIEPFPPQQRSFLLLAGLGLPEPRYLDLYRELPRGPDDDETGIVWRVLLAGLSDKG